MLTALSWFLLTGNKSPNADSLEEIARRAVSHKKDSARAYRLLTTGSNNSAPAETTLCTQEMRQLVKPPLDDSTIISLCQEQYGALRPTDTATMLHVWKNGHLQVAQLVTPTDKRTFSSLKRANYSEFTWAQINEQYSKSTSVHGENGWLSNLGRLRDLTVEHFTRG